MTARPSLRVHLCSDGSGLVTARLVARSASRYEVAATAQSDEQVLERLDARVESLLENDPDALDAFWWTEQLATARVIVEVRPQTTVQKRTVIGKSKIPLALTYVWAALASDDARERGSAAVGYRVMLPRFGWSFVLEDLGMAVEVLRQAVSGELGGQNARSLFELRESAQERVVEYKLRRRAKRRVPDPLAEQFATLRQVAEDWSALGRGGKLGVHYGPVDADRYSALVAAERKPSLLVVGPSGAGKTAWVKELARRTGSAGAGEARVWATSADRIMAGMQYLGMWEQRCLDLIAELAGEGHWLYVDRLAALAQQRTGASSIADLFLPALLDGEVSLIAEATEEELARLQVRDATLVSAFTLVRLPPPPAEKVVELVTERQSRKPAAPSFHPDAARRLVRHLELFRKDHAFPGKALAFLDWLDRDTTGAGRTLLTRDVDRTFSRWSGLPMELVSDEERGDVEALSGALRRRVIGQDAACQLAAEVLARFKAGVNDPEKPIGSLLFVGPTGVGKTELAKQLARFVFGSADRLIRIDMSEYLLGGSAARLLSDERGAESLATRVSREPLSLVLLDEIEKAHPSVFDLLLAVLGEGRLTTTSGRLVDFRMTLIVMTSNLGTGSSRAGFGQEGADPKDALRAVRQHFRPEFFNRLDHVVPFGELSTAALRAIVDLELDAVRQREGLERRAIRLVVSDEAKARLAELGFHPKYGARPLKRVIEERVMTPIAVAISRRPKIADKTAHVGVRDGEIEVTIA
jgi:ATP-dependent Clp protease ATP-binding subunit ClpC